MYLGFRHLHTLAYHTPCIEFCGCKHILVFQSLYLVGIVHAGYNDECVGVSVLLGEAFQQLLSGLWTACALQDYLERGFDFLASVVVNAVTDRGAQVTCSVDPS